MDAGPSHAGQTREPAAPPRGIARWIPALHWLKQTTPSILRADLVAGVTLAAYLIPAAIGDASLAHLSPEAGLYACLCAGAVFWLFCGSRRTSITVTSAISLLIGSSLGTLADGDASRYGALAACTAILVGLLFVIAWAARAGMVVNFISETVLIGFKCGVALYLASSQLPKLFGFAGAHGGGFWSRSGHFVSHLGETNSWALLVGGAALGVLVLGKIALKNKPVAIVVLVGGILAATWFNLEARGVKMLGDVPQGLPRIGLPAVSWNDADELSSLALACFMLAAVESAAIGRMFAAKSGVRFDPNQEFLALGAANLAAGLGQGLPVSGGMSQSLVNDNANARTPASGLVAAGLILVVALFLSGLLKNLPQPVLAAIVLMAVAGLFKISALKHLWRTDRAEFFIAIAALMGVLGSGLLRGVLVGAVLSLLRLIYLASHPTVAVLGRIPGTHRFSDISRHPDNQTVPGVLVCRPEGSLVYFNTDHVLQAILNAYHDATPAPRLVVCDLSATPRVDLAACEMLRTLATEIRADGTTLWLVETRATVRDALRQEGLAAEVGDVNRHTTVAETVDAFTNGQAAIGGGSTAKP